MSRPILADAFGGHHVWATLRLIDACQALTEEQLRTRPTRLGLAPPPIDAWDFAASQGRHRDMPAPAR